MGDIIVDLLGRGVAVAVYGLVLAHTLLESSHLSIPVFLEDARVAGRVLVGGKVEEVRLRHHLAVLEASQATIEEGLHPCIHQPAVPRGVVLYSGCIRTRLTVLLDEGEPPQNFVSLISDPPGQGTLEAFLFINEGDALYLPCNTDGGVLLLLLVRRSAVVSSGDFVAV